MMDWYAPPRVDPDAYRLILEYPELFDDAYAEPYASPLGARFYPMTFGQEIEQDGDDPVYARFLRVNRKPNREDGSGPLETTYGVYDNPLNYVRELARHVERAGGGWLWKSYDGDLSYGSHLHFRPKAEEIIARLTAAGWIPPELGHIPSEAEVWSITWNTLALHSLLFLPLLIMAGAPRPLYSYWAGLWAGYHLQRSNPYERVHNPIGFRTPAEFNAILRGVRMGDEHFRSKHPDGYKHIALGGTVGDFDEHKPLTIELRITETHPLFAVLFVRTIQKIVRYALEQGSEPIIGDERAHVMLITSYTALAVAMNFCARDTAEVITLEDLASEQYIGWNTFEGYKYAKNYALEYLGYEPPDPLQICEEPFFADSNLPRYRETGVPLYAEHVVAPLYSAWYRYEDGRYRPPPDWKVHYERYQAFLSAAYYIFDEYWRRHNVSLSFAVSPFPPWRSTTFDRYTFASPFDYMRKTLQLLNANKGTPWYRAMKFITHKCNLHYQNMDDSRKFWLALGAEPGEFEWSACDIDREPPETG